MDGVRDLVARWRGRADALRPYAPAAARAFEVAAGELEDAIRAAESELVNLAEAAQVSGYSKRRLRELVNEGRLENVGRKGAPRFRRGDLPRKPKRDRGREATYDAEADARALLARLDRAA